MYPRYLPVFVVDPALASGVADACLSATARRFLQKK